MTISLRPAEARGYANHGWLDTHYTFSFSNYYDPAYMGFRALRVLNDEFVKPAAGFSPHGHKNMEIVSYVVSGALSHKDSTGGEGLLNHGDVQIMTAGTGVQHSEFNASPDQDVHLVQIWILPQADNLAPSHAQAHFTDEQKRNNLCLLVSPSAEGGSLLIRQDASVYASLLDKDATVSHPLKANRGAWLHVIKGAIDVNGTLMKTGDGAGIAEEPTLTITAQEDSEFLLFDLA